MNKQTIGWDVGGAHLKAALLDSDGNLLQVLQVPCALWRGLHELEAAIDIVLDTFAVISANHAVTMTGELVDLFANRREGVLEISRVMQLKLNATLNHNLRFYTGNLHPNLSNNLAFTGFVEYHAVNDYWQYIASANWQASASFVAKKLKSGLFIDVGSTTSDFVLFNDHQPKCIGYTDALRMQSDELVYTGVVRTPLMAVAQKIVFKQLTTSVAAEYFATSADVYRLTGDLFAEDDMAETADAQDKSQLASARRIARMIGRDVEDAPITDWLALADEFKFQQISRLQAIALNHISRLNNESHLQLTPLVGAGAGRFLVRQIAKDLGFPYIDVADLIKLTAENSEPESASLLDKDLATHRMASVCLPAYAVAYLSYYLAS